MKNNEKVSRKKLITRIVCGLLAFLMIGSTAYYTIYFIISMFAK